jgi:hypothetical protein
MQTIEDTLQSIGNDATFMDERDERYKNLT